MSANILRLCLLRIMDLLHQHLLAMAPECGQMRRRGVRRRRWNLHPVLVPPPLHLLLLRDLQEASA